MAEAAPSGLISFGLCGALDPALTVGRPIIADAVTSGRERWETDHAWGGRLRAALPGAARGDLAAGDVIVGTPAAKAALRQASGAAAVDMESHAAAAAAHAAGLPFAVLRVVSDAAGRVLPKAAQAGFKADGQPDIGAVIAALARRPWELPSLIRVGLEAEQAFRALVVAADALKSIGGTTTALT